MGRRNGIYDALETYIARHGERAVDIEESEHPFGHFGLQRVEEKA